jgi:hypothetical protein
MGHKLRDICQHLPIRRLIAAMMRCAKKDETEGRILDSLVSWFKPCLEQSPKERLVLDFVL